ncbi:MAG: cytochrome C oxidase subunit IV family protein [Flavobacteriales bacterium]|nr:cytochrome C oxidase subunit IV family protein [Flavobacteriales bacterium]
MSQNNSNETKKIWYVFSILLALICLEVILGVHKPLTQEVLKWTFIVLTLVKAYYIVAYFMHMKRKRRNFTLTMAFPSIIVIPYILFILLIENGALIV